MSGTENYVGELFAGHQIQTEPRILVIEHESMEVWQAETDTASATGATSRRRGRGAVQLGLERRYRLPRAMGPCLRGR
jgi:hypothetical protein